MCPSEVSASGTASIVLFHSSESFPPRRSVFIAAKEIPPLYLRHGGIPLSRCRLTLSSLKNSSPFFLQDLNQFPAFSLSLLKPPSITSNFTHLLDNHSNRFLAIFLLLRHISLLITTWDSFSSFSPLVFPNFSVENQKKSSCENSESKAGPTIYRLAYFNLVIGYIFLFTQSPTNFSYSRYSSFSLSRHSARKLSKMCLPTNRGVPRVHPTWEFLQSRVQTGRRENKTP